MKSYSNEKYYCETIFLAILSANSNPILGLLQGEAWYYLTSDSDMEEPNITHDEKMMPETHEKYVNCAEF